GFRRDKPLNSRHRRSVQFYEEPAQHLYPPLLARRGGEGPKHGTFGARASPRTSPASGGKKLSAMTGPLNPAGPHLPKPAPIEAYGDGGFRFAGMSHRGSLMCLPNGIWASPVKSASEIDETALALALDPVAPEAAVDHFLIGTGRDSLPMSAP